MFSGPYNEAMQVGMGETSLGNSKLNIMSTVCGFPDYNWGIPYAHPVETEA